jgi:hypothetical protein
VLLTMPASLWLPPVGQRLTALVMGGLLALLLGGASWALSLAVPKAAYVLNVLALVCCVGLRWRDEPGEQRPIYVLLMTTAWFWLLATMVIVADYWGGTTGRWTSLAAGLALAGVWAAMLLEPRLWPLHRSMGAAGWRKRALLVAGLLLVMALVAAVSGGGYLRDRVATWKEDGQTRLTHWRDGLRLLHGPEQWLLGKGAGRFLASNFYEGPDQARVGDYRLRTDEGEAFLALSSGKHQLGYGEQFRVSQRIAAPAPGAVQIKLTARTASEAKLVLEICEKNLLYIENCSTIQPLLKPQRAEGAPEDGPGAWQTSQFNLPHVPALGGDWWAPRFVTFSVTLDSRGSRVDIAHIAMQDSQGRQLLANGDFNREMARWFFSSDRHHLPWHIKNAALHVLFEQGLIGLALLGSAYVLVLVRLSFGRGRDHPLAPAIVAALIGFGTVGAFDSLLDAPRIGFLFFTLLLLGLGLRALPGEGVARVA